MMSTTERNGYIRELNEFDKANTKLRGELRLKNISLKIKQDVIKRLVDEAANVRREADEVWSKRLRETEEMHSLQTANLQRRCEKLTEMLVDREMMKVYTPVIVKSADSDLLKENELIRDALQQIRKITDCY